MSASRLPHPGLRVRVVRALSSVAGLVVRAGAAVAFPHRLMVDEVTERRIQARPGIARPGGSLAALRLLAIGPMSGALALRAPLAVPASMDLTIAFFGGGFALGDS